MIPIAAWRLSSELSKILTQRRLCVVPGRCTQTFWFPAGRGHLINNPEWTNAPGSNPARLRSNGFEIAEAQCCRQPMTSAATQVQTHTGQQQHQ